MNKLNHYQIESSFGKFEIRFEDDLLNHIDINVSPKLFKKFCIEMSKMIIVYEESYEEIDLDGKISCKSQVSSSYNSKDLKAFQIHFSANEFKFDLTFEAILSSEEYSISIDPFNTKFFVVDCCNAIVQYEEANGTIEI